MKLGTLQQHKDLVRPLGFWHTEKKAWNDFIQQQLASESLIEGYPSRCYSCCRFLPWPQRIAHGAATVLSEILDPIALTSQEALKAANVLDFILMRRGAGSVRKPLIFRIALGCAMCLKYTTAKGSSSAT